MISNDHNDQNDDDRHIFTYLQRAFQEKICTLNIKKICTHLIDRKKDGWIQWIYIYIYMRDTRDTVDRRDERIEEKRETYINFKNIL